MEAEVLQITHEQGKLELTAGHLLFAQKASDSFAPTVARDVRPGHRLAAPWVDGSVAKPEVLRIDTVRRKGLFAPLLACGTLLVDGTAASCYALPTPIAATWPQSLLWESGSSSLAKRSPVEPDIHRLSSYVL
ncbi:Desert hedgehog protein A (Cephalic hedgehog protein) (Desert hedgehog protein 1) (DHH-1) (X-CHH) [Cleaved into: Desert hedgehog protein A N-product [Durusdinium trenchii]|uniref:Desert hedgehog protein A (Cephalic hedgehog protein) (Desert hedgehog protein 1) (DHH-1) (X-CHH) [Cleaved into: Desert hedgehog protein A N-product n=1 Tax=Durusdinium trenchii TaxID=1381693 RepID=A0ABP0HI40_9DINO